MFCVHSLVLIVAIIVAVIVALSHGFQIDTSLSSNLGHLVGVRRRPLGASPRLDVLQVHGVNFLKTATLAFNDEEVDNQTSNKVASSKDVTVQEIDITSNEGCEETNAEVPGPVGRSRNGHSLGSVSGGENLGLDGPDHGTPSSGVAENKETRKNDQHNASSRGLIWVFEIEKEVADGSKDEEANGHPDGTSNQRLATAKVFDNVQTDESDAKVDAVEDDLRDERVNSNRSENGRSVVEEVVCTYCN